MQKIPILKKLWEHPLGLQEISEYALVMCEIVLFPLQQLQW